MTCSILISSGNGIPCHLTVSSNKCSSIGNCVFCAGDDVIDVCTKNKYVVLFCCLFTISFLRGVACSASISMKLLEKENGRAKHEPCARMGIR